MKLCRKTSRHSSTSPATISCAVRISGMILKYVSRPVTDDGVGLEHLATPIGHGKVRAANSAPPHLDDDLALTRCRVGTILDCERLADGLENGCAHLAPSGSGATAAPRAEPNSLTYWIVVYIIEHRS
jgi:hypothetical protein